MNVYIAGPMRGYDRHNFPAFDEAFQRWSGAGHRVITPAALDRALSGDELVELSDTPDNPVFFRRAIQIDVLVICSVDAIALLPGWERSRGTTVELALAQMLGLPIYDAMRDPREGLLQLYPPTVPWGLLSSLGVENAKSALKQLNENP